MCGIVAAASQSNIIKILADGLKHLEYRGYDSSGIAFIQNKNISSYKKEGNVSELTKGLLTRIRLLLIRMSSRDRFQEIEVLTCNLSIKAREN